MIKTISDFFESFVNAVAEQDKTAAYHTDGFSAKTYQFLPRDYEAIQLQDIDKSVGNHMDVVAFLVESRVAFFHCQHGRLYIHTGDGLERLDDGEWVVVTDHDGTATASVYGENFLKEFGLKPMDEGGSAYRKARQEAHDHLQEKFDSALGVSADLYDENDGRD